MAKRETFSLDQFPAGCLVSDVKRRICFSNNFIEQHFGYPADHLIGSDLFTIFSRASQIICDSYLLPLLLQDGHCDEIRLSIITHSGEAQPVLVSVRRDDDDRDQIFWSIAQASRSEQMFEELNATKELLEQKVSQLHAFADKDQLTGLPNRVALNHFLNRRLKGEGAATLSFALAFVDLDGFKSVNDQHGHCVGDQLLQFVARRLAGNLRSDDLMARFGGDEFIIVLNGQFDDNSAIDSFNRIIGQLSKPFDIGTEQLHVAASIGVTFFPQAADIEPDQLIRQADQAMYQAKLAGRNQVSLFNIEREQSQHHKNQEVTSIKAAMMAGEFELHYQPKVNMRTGEVLGAEALLRWNHPNNGLQGPMSFLPAVSDTMTGIELGRWVVASALKQLRQWHEQGLDLQVSINIDGYHLQHPDFLADLCEILAESPDLPKNKLELEVLETSTMEDIRQVSSVLKACRTLGIQVSLDDFGTGYSTLSHLRDLSVDTLKIDRTFVKDMLTSPGDLAILKGVIGFANAFQCDVIAEGVETWQHAQSLIELGCESGQGYFIARPMPAHQLKPWLENWGQQGFQQKCQFADAQ